MIGFLSSHSSCDVRDFILQQLRYELFFELSVNTSGMTNAELNGVRSRITLLEQYAQKHSDLCPHCALARVKFRNAVNLLYQKAVNATNEVLRETVGLRAPAHIRQEYLLDEAKSKPVTVSALAAGSPHVSTPIRNELRFSSELDTSLSRTKNCWEKVCE